MTNTVSPETGRKLAAAGFPQPAPAPGQWWGDDERLILVVRQWQDIYQYFIVIEHLETPQPGVNRYFDTRDFRGLVFLPTVGDILIEIPGCSIGAYYNKWEVLSDNGGFMQEHKTSPAEAAALAFLSIHEKK